MRGDMREEMIVDVERRQQGRHVHTLLKLDVFHRGIGGGHDRTYPSRRQP